MTHASQLPRGAILRAYNGSAVVRPDMDFETYSEAGYVWQPPHIDAAGKQKPGRWGALPWAPDTGKDRYGLGAVGAAKYAAHPSTEVLSLTYDVKDGCGPRHWKPGMPNPQDLFDWVATGGQVEAWNVAFERWIWLFVCTRKYGWPAPPPIWQLRCAMAKSRHFSLPGKLEEAGNVLRLDVQKDKKGASLLDLFSKPRQPTIKDPRPRICLEDEPERAQELFDYNRIDIVSEAEASARVPDQEGEELDFWQCDLAMNARGVAIDVATIDKCIAIIEQCEQKYNAELFVLTGGAVDSASKRDKLLGWLGAYGVRMDSLNEEALSDMLQTLGDRVTQGDLHPDEIKIPYRALEIRAAVASASVKKVYSMRLKELNGRLFDLYSYHAARTGRVTGNGPQPTNLPKEGPKVSRCPVCRHYHARKLSVCPWCAYAHPVGMPYPPDSGPVDWCPGAVEDAIICISTADLYTVEYYFVDALDTIAGCLRGLFVAAPGCELISSDYNSIEAVCAAVIAREQWRLDVFMSHGKIYEMGASRITGIPFEEYIRYKKETGSHHPTRQGVGKISELAGGYGGGVKSYEKFIAKENIGKKTKIKFSEEELKEIVYGWRQASPAIVHIWGGQWRRTHAGWVPERFGIEGASIYAMLQPGVRAHVTRSDGSFPGISFLFDREFDILYLTLPSGRDLKYHAPLLEWEDRWGREQYALSYEGWNTNQDKGGFGWIRMRTYGANLFENVCQAVARDILRTAIVKLERAGYPVVMQTYDEIVAEVREGTGSVEHFEAIMMDMPEWAKEYPIRATGGWRDTRYHK